MAEDTETFLFEEFQEFQKLYARSMKKLVEKGRCARSATLQLVAQRLDERFESLGLYMRHADEMFVRFAAAEDKAVADAGVGVAGADPIAFPVKE